MIIARVAGTVWATCKHARLNGQRMLLCQPVALDGTTANGRAVIALDRVDAGQGDLVLVHGEGGGARLMFGDEQLPLRFVVVAVIDDLAVDEVRA